MIPDVLDPRVKIVDEYPAASTWLNYAGDHRGSIGLVMGPNTVGEYLTVVFCAYNEQTEKSHVGLAFGVYVRPVPFEGLPASTDVEATS